MPLRDHFTKNVPKQFRWEGFHSQWAATIVRHLNRGLLPPRYHAEPRVRLGTEVEVDAGALEERAQSLRETSATAEGSVAVYSPPEPLLTLEADLSQDDAFEVLIFDDGFEAELVAAIELVSPANKDRPRSRHEFVVKCARLLKADVSLVLVDIVTDRHANLFEELLEYLEIRGLDNPLGGQILYACSLLPRGTNGQAKIGVWPAALQVGATLPQLPLWLRDDFAVPLHLEITYEDTCKDLRA
jgi:hypothetical protein